MFLSPLIFGFRLIINYPIMCLKYVVIYNIILKTEYGLYPQGTNEFSWKDKHIEYEVMVR